jgi:hypothetical protein
MEINYGKYKLLFFNTPQAIQAHLIKILCYQHSILPFQIMGVPLVENSLKHDSWDDLLSRMAKKLDSWSFMFHKSGRETGPYQIFPSINSHIPLLGLIIPQVCPLSIPQVCPQSHHKHRSILRMGHI